MFTNQKFSLILEIHFLDSINIIVPGTTAQIGSDLLNGLHMQIFDRFLIGRYITTQGEHKTCPRYVANRASPLTNALLDEQARD